MRSVSRNKAIGVKSVGRALNLLDELHTSADGRSLSDLCERTKLPKGTVHRLLSTLIEYDFVEQEAHRYRVGVSCFVVGNAFRGHMDLRPRALPALLELRNRTGEAVQMAILEKRQVIYIERVQSKSPVAFFRAQVGAVVPAYCTALGKVLLAFSSQQTVDQFLRTVPLRPRTPTTIIERQKFISEITAIRERGYAVDRGEHHPEVRCIAAPIFDHDSKVVAAISVAGPAERMPAVLERGPFARAVADTAAQISRAIGHVTASGTATALHKVSRQAPLLERRGLRTLAAIDGIKNVRGLVRRSREKV